ncbi:SET domain-containing protein [Diplodia seriata]|uniref:SET domain-containing protein n=1 Tax=Diplodia seriata TaxID=420778 RepID=A0A1S8B570_9PEZI|nr:SET domain-containing protein [Diplodia seriata]
MESHRLSIAMVADCLQPNWRSVLEWAQDDSILAATPCPPSTGYLYSWFIDTAGTPRPIDLPEDFRHVRESRVDRDVWPDPTYDPRRVYLDASYNCELCGREQLDDPNEGSCQCLVDIINATPVAVQVFETAHMGMGIRALQAFRSNKILGEFVGIVGMADDDIDVLRSSTHGGKYQICQRREGNWTRYINHACDSNAAVTKYLWRGIERMVVMVREDAQVAFGEEITVHYGNSYWAGKQCLCSSCLR